MKAKHRTAGLLLTGLLMTGCATSKDLELLRASTGARFNAQAGKISQLEKTAMANQGGIASNQGNIALNRGGISSVARSVEMNASDIATAKRSIETAQNNMKEIEANNLSSHLTLERNVDAALISAAGERRELDFRIETIEYSLERDRTAILSGESTGYRSILKAAEKTSGEMASYVKGLESNDYAIFVRDIQNVDGGVSVLGNRTTEEFTTLLKKRLGDEGRIYNEGTVIDLYQRKNLHVPQAEAFNLDNLEKGGFNSEHVLIISGKLDATPRSIRLSLGATDLKDPQFRQSAQGTIIRDEDISQAYMEMIKQ